MVTGNEAGAEDGRGDIIVMSGGSMGAAVVVVLVVEEVVNPREVILARASLE